MKIRHALGWLALTKCFVAASAQAFEITPVGSFELSYLFNPPGSSTGTGWGYGVLLGQYVHSDVELESGLLYLARASSQGNPTSVTSTYYYEEVPLLVRVKPNGSPYSFGFGGYYARGIGNIRNSNRDGSSTSVSFEDMRVSREDFGALVAFGFRWGFWKSIEFYTDARFAWGLKNINLAPGGQTETWRDYFQAIAGLSFSLG